MASDYTKVVHVKRAIAGGEDGEYFDVDVTFVDNKTVRIGTTTFATEALTELLKDHAAEYAPKVTTR